MTDNDGLVVRTDISYPNGQGADNPPLVRIKDNRLHPAYS